MARRFAVSILLVVLVVLAGCSQLASPMNEPTDTQTAAGANTTTSATTTGSTQASTTTAATPSPTAAPSPTSTPTPSATPSPTATATPTPTSTATATRTPTPTATPTATPTSTATPTPTATATPTATSSPTPEPRFVVIIGGEPDDKVTYRMTVTGSIERRSQSYGAPIDDDGVTADPDIDSISGSTVDGRLGGGGDAYRITGEITGFETEDESAVEVYVDGEQVEFDDGRVEEDG